MNLILCDDHPIVMASMATMFEANGHDVVATTGDPHELAALTRDHDVDVCVTDLLFDDEGEPDVALHAIAEVAPLADVVVITGAEGDSYESARLAGAAAVGSKALPAEEILALVEGRIDAGARASRVDRRPHFLTDREVEVLQGLSDGDSTELIADRLGVRQATVRSHVQSILLKLGVHSRLAAVSQAVTEGLVQVG